MQKMRDFQIRRALPEECARLGRLVVGAYASLPGMPRLDEQPGYYGMLLDVGKRASNPAISIFAAVSPDGRILGCVDFIADMRQYGSGGGATQISDAAGIPLLAVAPEARGAGVGKALTEYCIHLAVDNGKSKVILHTTKAMKTAWKMYEKIGFVRLNAIDFQQGTLEVCGFVLNVER